MKKNKTSIVETANHFTTFIQFGMHCSDYTEDDHSWATVTASEIWKDTTEFQVGTTKFADNYDPYNTTSSLRCL